jgi:hypothetical protein
MDLRSVYVTKKNGRWIAIWQLWIRLGTTLLHSVGVGHVAGFPCREAAMKLHTASMLPDKDTGSGHARFLGWTTTYRMTELTPMSPLPSLVVAFCFPAPILPELMMSSPAPSPVVAFRFPAPFSPPTGFFSRAFSLDQLCRSLESLRRLASSLGLGVLQLMTDFPLLLPPCYSRFRFCDDCSYDFPFFLQVRHSPSGKLFLPWPPSFPFRLGPLFQSTFCLLIGFLDLSLLALIVHQKFFMFIG